MKKQQTFAISVLFLILFIVGCPRGPFQYVPVSGKVTYEDGTPIPAAPVYLVFTPLAPPLDPKTYPRPAMAIVDKTTGEFKGATSNKINDGLVPGKHKVTLSGEGGGPLSASLAPPEYGNVAKTPLEVDTAKLPFNLKIPKPKR